MPHREQRRPIGAFEAISYNVRTGFYLRTRHNSRAAAQRRLDGNPRHTRHNIVDHTEALVAAALAERKAQAKKGWVPEAQPYLMTDDIAAEFDAQYPGDVEAGSHYAFAEGG